MRELSHDLFPLLEIKSSDIILVRTFQVAKFEKRARNFEKALWQKATTVYMYKAVFLHTPHWRSQCTSTAFLEHFSIEVS